MDTRATDHVAPCLQLLKNVVSFRSTLHLPNGAPTEVTHMGSIMLSSDIQLHNVLYVPMFAYNLLSVSKLLSDSQCVATFTSQSCSLEAPNWNSYLDIGKASNDLYLLSQVQLGKHNDSVLAQNMSCAVKVNKKFSLHYRLCHVPYTILKLLPVDGLSHDISPCDSCILAKQTIHSFPTNHSHTSAIFELVQLWGPYRHKNSNNCTLFLIIVDDKSKATWVYLLSDKSHVVKLFTNFINFVEDQFSTSIKFVRSDNGYEFINKAMLSAFAKKRNCSSNNLCIYLSTNWFS